MARPEHLIALGDGSKAQNEATNLPGDLVLDRILVRGDPAKGQKRGIALNSAGTIIRNSYIGDIKAVGIQSRRRLPDGTVQGRILSRTTVPEAAGVNLLFGGSDPAIPDFVPIDITIRAQPHHQERWPGGARRGP